MKTKFIITDKYHEYKNNEYIPKEGNNKDTIVIDDKICYQTIKGFGGSFTESACYNLTRVSEALQEEALQAYFDHDKGIGYTLGRISMNSCDFSLYKYSYVDDYDDKLETFNISHDQQLIIPTINRASTIAKKNIKIMVSPWSPPWWMKDNQDMEYGGHLKSEYYTSWANYYVKYIQALQKTNINVFSLTVQNEPAAKQRWDSCLYSSIEEKDFVKNYLGKALYKNHLDNLELYIWDHNRDIILDRVKDAYEDVEASKYIYGTAFHWYDAEQYENLKKHHELYPDKHLILSECCIEKTPNLHTYESGERYGRNIINNFINYSEGFIDWNLFLDETGGPNRVNNLCDAPVIINIRENRIVKQMSYYFIAQFSKYILPNAKMIKTLISTNKVSSASFKNTDGSIVTILLNETEEDFDFKLTNKKEELSFILPKKSILSIIMED